MNQILKLFPGGRVNGNGSVKLTWRESLKSDFPSSIIAFLVALPLCMGIAIASGAPPASGLITGIVGGIIVGSIAGSPLQVSGPAAGLFVLVAEVIRVHGLAAMGLVVLGAGAIQLVAGLARLGSWFRAVSPAVIQGMLSGIGVLILASQFHVMVDDKGPPKAMVEQYGKGVANLLTIPHSTYKGIVPIDGSTHHLAAAVGVGTIIVLIAWKLVPFKAIRIIPGAVVAVLLAASVAVGASLPIEYVDVPDNLLEGIRLPTPESLAGLLTPALLAAAVGIALVASAETMLCATAINQMQTHARADYDRELAAQGVGNMICGALGALPMTGVIVRSSVNVDAGARTRLSAILHGLWLLILVAVAPGLLRLIPMAALAAVLVYTGWKLINFRGIKSLWNASKAEGVICVLTLTLVVGVDLLTGVLVGIACAAARLLYTFARLHIHVQEQPEAGRTELHLRGAATFLALPKLASALDEVSPATELHVHLEELTYVDHACLEQFINWEKQHEATGGKLVMDWDGLTATFHRAGAIEARPMPVRDVS